MIKNKIFPLLIFLFFLISPCSAVTITTNVSINLTDVSISFDNNFTFGRVVVESDTLCMYNDSYSWCNFSVIPTNEVAINISTWNCTGDYRKTFGENASAGTVTEHIITGYPAGSVNVYKNGAISSNINVDSFGIIDWMYSGGYSTHVFDLVYSNLTASFSVNKRSGVNPLDVKFTDTSTGNPTSWYWTFGDGETSTAQSPYHTYDDEGVYTVTLNVSHANGFDVENKTNYINVDSRFSGSSDIATQTVPVIMLVAIILISCLGIMALRGIDVSGEVVKFSVGLLVIMIMIYLIYGIASLMEETFSILN